VTAASKDTWRIESLRLTLFWQVPAEPGYGAWAALTNEPPETQSSTPRSHAVHEEGPFLTGVLSTDATPERTDVLLVVGSDASPSEIPSLGEYPGTAGSFLTICSGWLAKQDRGVKRVAFGVVARMPVASTRAGYDRLQAFLPAVTLSPDSSDFNYQINRRRTSTVEPSVQINRLSRWSVVRLQYARIALDPLFRTAPAILGDPAFACRCELDLNTVAEFTGVLDVSTVVTVIDELKMLGSELLEVGDVP
jgi:hypothetical protein